MPEGIDDRGLHVRAGRAGHGVRSLVPGQPVGIDGLALGVLVQAVQQGREFVAHAQQIQKSVGGQRLEAR